MEIWIYAETKHFKLFCLFGHIYSYFCCILRVIVVSRRINFNPETTEALQINRLGMTDLFGGKANRIQVNYSCYLEIGIIPRFTLYPFKEIFGAIYYFHLH